MSSTKKSLLNKIFFLCLCFGFTFRAFSVSDEALKKQILSTANLAGETAESLMADDDEDDEINEKKSKKKEQKLLPSEFGREVVFTEEMTEFMDAFYNHEITDDEIREKYYTAAKKSAEGSEYERLVQLARADYYMGMSIFEGFDLTSLDNIDLSDGSSEETLNDLAGSYFDSAIAFAESALELKVGTDAYTILAHSISANCTAKNTAYILGNGLKVRAYAKKAVKLDYSNGTAHFLTVAQDIYAPWPFARIRAGRKQCLSFLNDKYIRIENQDRLLICMAIGHSYYRQKKWTKAVEWCNKALEVYPNNVSVHILLNRIEEKRKK